MAALWEQFDGDAQLTAQGTVVTTEIYHNEVDDHVFASAPITVVDGIMTFITDTDDLFSAHLLVAPEIMTAGDVATIPRHGREMWYSWFVARGPLVFRLRSKRTIHPEQKLWMHIVKQRGGTASALRWGFQMLNVRHQ